MKKLLPLFFIVLLFSFSAAVWGQKIELIEPQGVLTDYSGYISPSAREKINELAERLHSITSVNLRVVVVRQLDPIDPETYGRQLYDRWDIGQTREHLDHGVLLLISIVDRP
ncbi:MAG: TPM domain-containing protein, partial [Candidatus Margulisbacteria bacterium]|nr:TPM domain-containing protein [Candidatus Margulisiibacteriota bacterium]